MASQYALPLDDKKARVAQALAKAKARSQEIAARPDLDRPRRDIDWTDVGKGAATGARSGLESTAGLGDISTMQQDAASWLMGKVGLGDTEADFDARKPARQGWGDVAKTATKYTSPFSLLPTSEDIGGVTDKLFGRDDITRHTATTPQGQNIASASNFLSGLVGGPENLGKDVALKFGMSMIPAAKLAGKVVEKGASKGGREVLTEAAAAPKMVKPAEAAAAPNVADPTHGFERVHDPQEFHSTIAQAKAGSKFGAAVELKPVEDYPTMSMFLSPDRKAGFAVKPGDGDLVSVFSTEKGRLPSIMSAAKTFGAKKLDAFDTSMSGAKEGLPQKYGQYGFQETRRMPWEDQYAPPDWAPDLGKPDNVEMELPQQPLPPPGEKMPVEGTWGKKDRPDVMFEDTSPHEFTPGQWGRFGKHYGAHNIGPENEQAWYHSLQPFTSKSGKVFSVPGGLEDKTPFTYFDDLYMKAQGINPNDLTPEQHLAIHNRTVAGKQAPPGGFTDAHIFNQLGGMGILSPNNPLTPNEFAAAATMAKGSGATDLAEISKAAGPEFDYRKHPMFGETDALHGESGRRVLSNDITKRLGTQGAEKGGSGVSGNADYTNLVGLSQMIREKPDFFRFRGAGEAGAGATDDTQWLNFVDRLQTQVPGLAGKTGSFGGVWQDPVNAATSAMDRHMLNTFRDKVFENPQEEALWNHKVLDDWNNPKPKKPKKQGEIGDNGGPPLDEEAAVPVDRKKVSTIDELRAAPGGTNFFNDKIFGYVNKAKKGQAQLAKTGDVNPNTPEHLRPENADWVKQPKEFVSMGPAMRRGIAANKASKEASGATGVFSDQWRVWDPIRNRFEPHEINQPGLTDLPRQSEAQHAAALQTHADLGYLNYTKDEAGNLQPVRPSTFDPVAKLSPQRESMKAWLKGVDPSKLAYFSLLLGIPLSELTGAGSAGEGARRNEDAGGAHGA